MLIHLNPNLHVLVVLPTGYGRSLKIQTYLMASRQLNNRKSFACLPASSNTRLLKQGHLNQINCGFLLGINFDSFSCECLSTKNITLRCCNEEDFPVKSDLPNFILAGSLSCFAALQLKVALTAMRLVLVYYVSLLVNRVPVLVYLYAMMNAS